MISAQSIRILSSFIALSVNNGCFLRNGKIKNGLKSCYSYCIYWLWHDYIRDGPYMTSSQKLEFWHPSLWWSIPLPLNIWWRHKKMKCLIFCLYVVDNVWYIFFKLALRSTLFFSVSMWKKKKIFDRH